MRIVPHIDESIDQVIKGVQERLHKRRQAAGRNFRQGENMRKFIDKLDIEKRMRTRRKRTGEGKKKHG